MTTAAIVVVLIVPATTWAVQEQPVPQMAGVAQAAVTGCAQAHPMAERTIDGANRRLETARQANSPAAMSAALDDLQATLRQLRTDIAPCADLPAVSAAGVPSGHVMPGGQQMPDTAPAPLLAPAASGTADPHAGHVMPAAPQTSAAAPRAAPAQRPAADPHAGMVMPAAHPAQVPGAAATAGPALTSVENPAARLADLLCQPQMAPDTATRATHMGKAYYFCTAADRDLFLKAPAKSLQR